MKRKAFTLIELLVVIAIIALLLAILMPGLQKAKQHALRMLCKTYLHNYGLAGNMYLSDNDERFVDPWQNIYDSCQGRHAPGACDQSTHQQFLGEPSRFCRWHNIDYNLTTYPEYAGPLWQYLESQEVSLCPVFSKVASQHYEKHTPPHNATIEYNPQFGYSQNAYLGGTNYGYGELFGSVSKLNQVMVPARTFFFAEENPWPLNRSADTWNGQRYSDDVTDAVLNDTALLARTDSEIITAYADGFGTFHSPPGGDYNEGTTNAVMLDGSVEQVRPQDQGTFKKAWPKTGMVLR